MHTVEVLLCLASVSLASVGQVLLRAATLSNAQAGRTGAAVYFNIPMLVAVAVYASALLLWLHVLSRVPLSQAFAFFGLTYLVVPLLAYYFLGDPVTPNTWIGAAVIMVGIAVTNWPLRG